MREDGVTRFAYVVTPPPPLPQPHLPRMGYKTGTNRLIQTDTDKVHWSKHLREQTLAYHNTDMQGSKIQNIYRSKVGVVWCQISGHTSY